ncbi:MAG: copper resistance protein CopC, partial [Gemmatimonadetes bacterium]|nr:copper resistance protein CopC [Gemmatimonadota bacterium]
MQDHLLRPRGHPRTRWTASSIATILMLVAVGATLAWAAVHIRLESSVPAAGEVLTTAPERFELRFSGPVNQALSSLVLVTPSGDSVRVTLRRPGDDDRILIGKVPELASGEHRVLWSTVSADGHPVSGEFGFSFAGVGVAAADEPIAQGGGESGAADRESESRNDGVASDQSRQPGPGEEIAASVPPAGKTLLAGLGLACLLAFSGLLWYAGATRLIAEPSVRVPLAILGWSALVLLLADLSLWILQVRIPGSGLSSLWPALESRSGVVAGARLLLLLGALWT